MASDLARYVRYLKTRIDANSASIRSLSGEGLPVKLRRISGGVETQFDTVSISLSGSTSGGSDIYQLLGESGGLSQADANGYSVDNEVWVEQTDAPGSRAAPAAAHYNGVVYVAGGDTGGGSASDSTFAYDIANDTWSTKVALPTARWGLSAFPSGSNTYYIGGYDGTSYYSDVDEFDPGNNSYSSKTAMPTARADMAIGVDGDTAYVVGGTAGTGPLATNEAYDAGNDSWDGTVTDAPVSRKRGFGAVESGTFYYFGGLDSNDSVTADANAYDIGTDSWSSITNLPTARAAAGCALGSNGDIYIIGGTFGSGATDSVIKYDPGNDSYTTTLDTLPDTIQRMGIAPKPAATITGAIIDTLEDSNISEYGGKTSEFSTTTSVYSEGSVGLKADGGSTGEGINSTSGLDNYPSAGDTFRARIFPTSISSDCGIVFGAQSETSEPDGYRATVDLANGNVKLTVQGASGSATGSIPVDQRTVCSWITLQVDWGSSGSITAKVFDNGGTELGSTTLTDSTYTSGGFGWFNDDLQHNKPIITFYDDARLGTNVPTTAGTEPGNLIESFEDGNLDEYTTNATVVDESNEPVSAPDGAKLIKLGQGDGTFRRALSTSGLARYPTAGDKFRFTIWGDQSASRYNIGFGTQGIDDKLDGENGYTVSLDAGNGTIYLRENPGPTRLAEDTSFIFSTSEFLDVEVDWQTDGTITVVVYDSVGNNLTSITGSSTTYKAGGIGFQVDDNSSGTTVMYGDHVRLV